VERNQQTNIRFVLIFFYTSSWLFFSNGLFFLSFLRYQESNEQLNHRIATLLNEKQRLLEKQFQYEKSLSESRLLINQLSSENDSIVRCISTPAVSSTNSFYLLETTHSRESCAEC
jgi:predicted Zn-dependent peptidase